MEQYWGAIWYEEFDGFERPSSRPANNYQSLKDYTISVKDERLMHTLIFVFALNMMLSTLYRYLFTDVYEQSIGSTKGTSSHRSLNIAHRFCL
jgi:hypothetical protein